MDDLSKYLCPEKDDLNTSGVLTSDEIEYYVKRYKMIDPFDPKSLKPAGYELHLGEDYAIGGKCKKLSPEKPELEIPPFEVAIISTKEIINLPRFIIARWNLRVRKVYEGLLWTGGPQVDPGWVGKLFCPIYNLSSEPVKLKLNEPIVLMDFIKTTPFKKGKTKEYHRPPKRQKLEDYNWGLKSALVTEAKNRMDEVEKKINRVEGMIGLIITAIVILFAALSIFVTSGEQTKVVLPLWVYFSVGLSVLAIAFSLFRPVKLPIKWIDIEVNDKKFWKELGKWFKYYGIVSIKLISIIMLLTGLGAISILAFKLITLEIKRLW